MTEFKITKVKKSTTSSESLSSTIPIDWARLLEIRNGDMVRWELSKDDSGRLYLILRRQD
jgi:hypothetical protein